MRHWLKADAVSSLSILGLRGGVLAAKLLLSLFIARYLGLESLGAYGLIAGMVAVGQAVMRLGLLDAIGRDAVGQPLEARMRNLRHYLTGCSALYALLLPIVLLVGLGVGAPILVLLVFLVLLSEHASHDVFVLANNLQRPRLANALFALQAGGWIYLYILAALVQPALRSLEALLAFWIGGGLLAVAAAAIASSDWPWRQAFSEPIRLGWYRSYLGRAWRLYLSEIVAITNLYADRYLVGAFLSLEFAGIYVLFWQVSNAVCNLVGASVLQVFRPRLIQACRDGDPRAFRRTLRNCARRCAATVAGLVLLSALLVPLLLEHTRQPLAMEHLPLLWLLLAFAGARVAADLSIATLFAQRADGVLLRCNLLTLALTLLLGSLALSLLGIIGAALAAICTCLITIGYTETARRHIGHEGFSSHRTRRERVPQDRLPLLDRDPCQKGR
ncbi:lipopolysaccharide biosynthesis protein [Stutzerimonas tarimensis]|uniref:Lipopolysaccharide biosynthesis protein n=1 Tax=Stutzerimonas tarimensis TaxID=1507735 RepID=A0ABV7T439_9GAMM